MQFRTKRIKLVAVVVGALIAATLGLSATPASAAEVHCTGFTWVPSDGGLYLHRPSTTGNSGNYNCVVVRGDHNYAVLALQESVNTCYSTITARLDEDSDFGTHTEQAVKDIQKWTNETYYGAGLSVDGRFGPKTSSWFAFMQYKSDGSHTTGCRRA
ncbi:MULTISPECIES: peptidoglycan-binding domain-containing protein [unclassified Streptomyces]|uniref:peptidoglycan-binding domain-containing protein n=1 Tax=unclassified Streptomyces TaxID=2593676 RepID=UPI0033DB70BF